MTRRSLLTILDALVIVLASAAIVIWLGGRAEIKVLGVRVLLLTAWRPALIALALTVLRFVKARRVTLLPALTPRAARALDGTKARFIAAPPLPRGLGTYAAATVAASLVWLTPQVLHPRSVPNHGDPIFSAWRLGRFASQLAHDPRHLFDGRIFYPTADTLTYSDATVLQGLVAAPFILAGADPLIVSNVLLLAAFPLRALAYFYAGWRLTLDPRAALISGILGALYPFHWEHYSHLELQFSCFIPLSIVAVLGLLAKPTIGRGAMLGSLVTLQWLSCMYFGVMLVAFLAPFAIVMALAWRLRPDIALLKSAACAALIAGAGFTALGVPYMNSRVDRGDRGFPLAAYFSATADEYMHPVAVLGTYQWISREHHRAERELFPGLVTPALAGLGAVPPLAAEGIACIVSGAIAIEWSLGAHGLTYDDLYRWVLPFRSIRVPARFAILAGTALVLLAAYGSVRVFRAVDRWRPEGAAVVLLALAALIDLRPALPLGPYWRAVPSIYASVTPSMVLAEFPLDIEYAPDQMYFSLTHGARLLGGSSGFFPVSFVDMQNQVQDFPSPASLDVLRRIGATHVTINCRFYGARCARVLDGLDAASGVRLIASAKWEGAAVRLYELH